LYKLDIPKGEIMKTVSKLVLALTLAASTIGSVAVAGGPGHGGGQYYGNRGGNTYVQQNNYNRGNYNRGYNNYNRGGNWNGNGWGYAGAAIAGAIIGGAIANSYSQPYYAPPPVYYQPPQYYAPQPFYNPYAPVAPIYSYPPPFIGN
jgi:hypothetical protein